MKTGRYPGSLSTCILRATQGKFIDSLLGEQQWVCKKQPQLSGTFRGCGDIKDPGDKQDLRDLAREMVRGEPGEGREQGRATG